MPRVVRPQGRDSSIIRAVWNMRPAVPRVVRPQSRDARIKRLAMPKEELTMEVPKPHAIVQTPFEITAEIPPHEIVQNPIEMRPTVPEV